MATPAERLTWKVIKRDLKKAFDDPGYYSYVFDSTQRDGGTFLTDKGATAFCAHAFPSDIYPNSYRTCCESDMQQQMKTNPCPGNKCTGRFLHDHLSRMNMEACKTVQDAHDVYDATGEVLHDAGNAAKHVAGFVTNQNTRSKYLNESSLGMALNNSAIGKIWGGRF